MRGDVVFVTGSVKAGLVVLGVNHDTLAINKKGNP
jgi:hypothetical protein